MNDMKRLFTWMVSIIMLSNISAQNTNNPAPSPICFDFGEGEVANGYIGVTSDIAYSETLGYGFESKNDK